MPDRDHKPGSGGPGGAGAIPFEPKTAMNDSRPELLSVGHTPAERCLAFLSAARSSSGDLRGYYCARARSAFGQAKAELEALEINLRTLESTLPNGAENG